MDEHNKLPLKRVELSLTNFNEVAIPHHLDLLRQYKANIIKYEEAGQYARAVTEQTHARRVAAQLRALLGELEALRRQLCARDLARFDRLTERARRDTLAAVADYLGERSGRPRPAESAPVRIASAALEGEAAGRAASTESVGLGELAGDVQLLVDEQEAELRAREAALAGWAGLQEEARALRDAWRLVHGAAHAAREPVLHAHSAAAVAANHVQHARCSIAAAHRLRAGAYGACGALAGALLGGPAGLLLGAKAGLAVGLAAGGLGYLGGAGLARAALAAPAASAAPHADRKKEL